jgi:hypothetical protein
MQIIQFKKILKAQGTVQQVFKISLVELADVGERVAWRIL